MALEEQRARNNPNEARTTRNGNANVSARDSTAATRVAAAPNVQNVPQDDDDPLGEFFGGALGVNRGVEYSGVPSTDRPQYTIVQNLEGLSLIHI